MYTRTSTKSRTGAAASELLNLNSHVREGPHAHGVARRAIPLVTNLHWETRSTVWKSAFYRCPRRGINPSPYIRNVPSVKSRYIREFSPTTEERIDSIRKKDSRASSCCSIASRIAHRRNLERNFSWKLKADSRFKVYKFRAAKRDALLSRSILSFRNIMMLWLIVHERNTHYCFFTQMFKHCTIIYGDHCSEKEIATALCE